MTCTNSNSDNTHSSCEGGVNRIGMVAVGVAMTPAHAPTTKADNGGIT